tara:strand:- start:1586 stop:5737 length:4152 start_codon:yes stop_codon:yes gene_type:complete
MAQKIVDPLGNLVEVEEAKKPGDNIRTGIVNNVFRDPAGNIIKVDKPVDVGFNFSSTSRNPKKDQRGFFEKYVTDPVTAGLAGVGEGGFKIAEGTLSLGTILLDLGVGTNLTRKVEKYFDDNKILDALEDKADESWTGTVTSVLTQFGVPGGVALKAANGLIKARNIGGKLAGKTDFISRRPNVTKAALAGGAEAAVATSDMGTLGDLIGMGPTQTDDSDDINATGREVAFKRLKNKFKFGVEGALGFTLFDNVIFPVGKVLFKGSVPAFTGMLKHVGVNKNNIRFLEFDPDTNTNVLKEKALDEGFQFNKNNILRWVDKNILSPFRARGNLPKEVFEANREKINTLRSVAERVRIETLDLEKAVQEAIDPDVGKLYNKLDAMGLRRREEMMENIYDFLTSGAYKAKVDIKTGAKIPKTAEEIAKALPDNIPKELLPSITKIRNSIDEMSKALSEMPNFTMKGGADFQNVVAANIGEYMTRSYRLFGTKVEREQWINTLNNTPEGQKIIEKAKTYIRNNNKDMTEEAVEQEFRSMLADEKESVLGGAIAKYSKYDDAIKQVRQDIPEPLRALLGEIKDPIKQYMRTAAKINTYVADTNFFNTLLKKGKNRFFFEPPKQIRGQQPSSVPIGEGGLEFGTTIVSDGPLNGFKTTPEIAKALENISNSRKNADELSNLYYKVFLAPKAWTQEAKTTLSPITHARNIISAASFTGMNGNFFTNPLRFMEDFKEAYKVVTARSKSAIESDMGRKYFKNSGDYEKYKDEYMKLQNLGVVNTSARLGELTQSLDEVTAGLQNLTETGKIFTILRGWGDKTGFNKARGIARTLYQAEDDLYKIQNFYSESRKFRGVYEKMYKENQAKFLKDFGDEIARVNPTLTRDEALASMRTQEGFDRFIDLKAADTVKNNIPNYDYIGSFGQTLRRLPVGNFVSFPLEIIRTSFNTLKQGIREITDPSGKLVGIGTTRLAGVATFGVALGKGLEEGAQLVAGVSNEQLNALREYLPEWSKDSTLIPIKQGNQLYYIDFSHTNAYDILTLPLRAAMNGFDESRDKGAGVLASFDDAVIRAASKFAAPFVEESIATQFLADVFVRGGSTAEGRRLWNPEDEIGTKISNTLAELFRTASPGSIKQFQRLYLSGIGQKDQYNRGFKFLNEASGLLGFRIQNPFVQDGINFKISDNKRALTNSKKLFTSVAYRADATSAEIVDAYNKANAAKLRNDQKLFKQIQAAKILGLSDREIRAVISERFSKNEAANLLRNRFTPIKVSDFAFQRMKENSQARDGSDVSRSVRRITNGIYRNLFRTNIFDDVGGLFKDSFNIIESPPLVTRPKTSDASPIIGDQSSLTAPVVPVTPIELPGGGTLSPSDRSQLAKSGDIDITEALSRRA